MRYIEPISIFMICLVLSLPFYSASVFAQTTGLTNVKVQGSDGYEGVVRDKDDTFTFSARACISAGVEVNKEKVRLWGTSNSTGFPFSSCTAIGDGCSYDCSFSRNMSDYSNICPSKDDFDVNLYKEDGSWLDDKEVEAICDSKAPFISVNLDGNDPTYYKTDSNVTFILFIRDDADGIGCVGIKNAVFKAAGYTKNIDINSAQNVCTYSSTLKELASSFNEGTVNLNVTAYDYFGQNFTKTLSFTTDFTVPQIVLDSFEIKNTAGNEIDYFSPQNVKLKLIINITDGTEVDSSTVIADLSNIGGSSSATTTCNTITSSKLQCEYSNIQYYLNESSFSKTITVNASDTAGNSKAQSISLSKSLNVDSTAPLISGLRLTDTSGNDIKDKWLGGENFSAYVYVNITENEIGLDQSTIYANLLELNPEQSSYSSKAKSSCEAITNTNITKCRFDITVDVNGSGSASKSLVFNASDLAGNNAETTLSLSNVFKKDSTKPLISGLSITDANNKELNNWTNGDIPSAFVYINITETGIGLDNSSVYANLSELNPSESSYSNKAKDDCIQKDNNITTCRFSAVIKINENGTVTKTLVFKAADFAGNDQSQSFSYGFKVDRTGPEFQLIKTNRSDANSRYWLGNGKNTIIAELKEEGIGLKEHNVFLDLSGILLGANTKANNCTAAGNSWNCYWYDIITSAASGNYTISSTLNSKDDANNAADKIRADNISMDKDNPLINNITYSPAYPTKGDTLVFSVNVSENLSGLRQVKIDVAPIRNNSNGSFFVGADYSDCTQDGNNYLCEIEFNNIIGQYVETELNVTAEDFAGNVGNKTIKVTIYKADTETVPDFFKIDKIESIPSSIDRIVAAKMPLKHFLHVFLVKKNTEDNVAILAKEISCSASSGYVSSSYLFNEDADDPYIVLTLSTSVGSITEGSFNPNCSLLLRVSANETLYKKAETENITKEITLYNNPLGEIDKNINEKLTGINNKIKDIEDEISNKEKWIKILGMWCTLAKAAGLFNSILQTIKSVYWGITSGLWAACAGWPPTMIPCQEGICAAWAAACSAKSTYHNIVDNLIWPPGMIPTGVNIIGMINKYSCMILFECALCDWTVHLSIGTEIAGGAIAGEMNVDKKEYIEDTTGGDPKGSYEKGISKEVKAFKADGSRITIEKGGKVFKGNDGNFYENEAAAAESMGTWKTTGRPTEVNNIKDSGNWIFNPYKSKHYAAACMCFPAMVYNLNKERQINCMYRNCLTNHLGTGTSSTVCDFAYKERECLYVESAQFKLHGYMGDFFNTLVNAILNNLPYLLASLAYIGFCAKYTVGSSAFCAAVMGGCPAGGPAAWGYYPMICGITGAAFTLIEIGQAFASKFGFDPSHKLKGKDYCSTGGALE